MAATARNAGWQVVVDRRTGRWQDKERTSCLVRLKQGGRRAVAQWLDGKAVSAYTWTESAYAVSVFGTDAEATLKPPEARGVVVERIGFRELGAILKAETLTLRGGNS